MPPSVSSTPHASRAPLILTLRHATAAAHARIEQLPVMVGLTSQDVSLPAYHAYLSAMAIVYADVESALCASLPPEIRARLAYADKLPALLADLEELGLPQPRSDQPSRFQGMRSATRDLSSVVGGLYVLEGATLGGHTIARHLRRRLGPAARGMVFLDFHGTKTAGAWRHFGESLEALREDGALAPNRVVAGALHTFDAMHRGLEPTSDATGSTRSAAET